MATKKKKGSKEDCNNARGISLLSVQGKIFTRILLIRINKLLEHVLRDIQCGFKTNRRAFKYRAAGCTGAYYQLELYFVCGELADLNAGIYHYAADTHTFRQIRSGDYRTAIVEATGNEPATAIAPVLLVATCTFWRNAWRYPGCFRWYPRLAHAGAGQHLR